MAKYEIPLGPVSDTYWTVLREVEGTGRTRYVLCRCVCGEERKVSWYNIKSGDSKSCGCRGKSTPRHTVERPAGCAVLPIDDEGARKMASAVLLSAANDYRKALKTGNALAKKEMEDFFKSPYCDSLLQLAAVEHSGKDIIIAIKKKRAKLLKEG